MMIHNQTLSGRRRMKWMSAIAWRITPHGNNKPRKPMATTRSAPQGFLRLPVRLHLTENHIVVEPLRVHQLLVRAPFDDATVLHQQNDVGAADRRQAVRDDERRPARE